MNRSGHLRVDQTGADLVDQDPLPGFRWLATTQYYAAYGRC